MCFTLGDDDSLQNDKAGAYEGSHSLYLAVYCIIIIIIIIIIICSSGSNNNNLLLLYLINKFGTNHISVFYNF